MIEQAVSALISYAISTNLIEETDKNWAINSILSAVKLDSFTESCEEFSDIDLASILKIITDDALKRGVFAGNSIVERDLFDTKLLGILTPRPSQVIDNFFEFYNKNPKLATDWYYEFSQNTNYIRRDRIKKDLKWIHSTDFGALELSINLAKPEFDQKTIHNMRKSTSITYPKCSLCNENEGYAGRIDHPARQNHRIIPIKLDEAQFFMQFSPYVYFNQHCVIFNSQHTPMQISCDTFAKLLSFVEQFPHYFLGANADLPIVGGSIATHDHFQGGNHTFALALAPILQKISFKGFDDIDAGIVKWPMSVIRLSSTSRHRIVELSDKILQNWKLYSDESASIFCQTNGENHNTITPIARNNNGIFTLDLVLRNNIQTAEYPCGLFHSHPEFHNIKKENIGLIEALGLAVLPARLKTEFLELSDALLKNKDLQANETTKIHANWVNSFKNDYIFTEDNVFDILKYETGKVFSEILTNCGIFKNDSQGIEAFMRFIEQI